MNNEKQEVLRIERASPYTSDSEYGTQTRQVEALDDDPEFSYPEQRKVIHRIDKRLVVMAGLMYCVSLMDRSNLPNAAVAGMNVELEMNVGFRYSTVALVFFITYTIFQPPATILTRKLGPRPFLAGLCIAWGAVMIGFGFVQNWVVLIPLRVLLGTFEAGFFPGCVFLISTWYARYDQQKRFALFYILGVVASGGSGILAYGLQQMDGLSGYTGWRWIFIIEGILTVIIGIAGYIFLVDFPDRAIKKQHWRFLKDNEILFIMRRIKKDRNDAEAEPWNFRLWLSGGTDWKVWSFALIFFCLTAPAYAMSYFLPILLRENMGFSVMLSQILSAPQYIFAAFVIMACAWFGDKYKIRGPLLLVNCILGIIGLPLLGFASSSGVRFFGTFLICASAQGGIPTCMAYQANNVRGHWKRAFTSATLIGGGGIGGIAGSLVFRSQDKPEYLPGIYACLVCNIIIAILVCVNTVYFRSENRKAERGEKVLEGDPNFRYTI
ncbi:hypothetical protein CKM354_001049700 [Cercospora kikuchii]|uniref:Major facilitator superfamily (MFS) profile domain-containing protein n=1 Tax=Cercospora kikuchii TaxID=84275 RepID=A0A9P3CVE0_9PEZI|nr:uncharacterized protein CKM354_001049700 [Cercospora kikuchii]GIZ47405.1 hypothetical protein CKM354_001049700 [Cercospora kikuchii]